MHLNHAILLFFGALIAGLLNAVAGGGSFISFPTLLFTGVPPVDANATNTVALWPGLAASSGAYFRRLDAPRRIFFPLLSASILGGLAGALLLLKTPQRTFMHLIPWLLSGATLLFIFGNKIKTMGRKTAAGEEDLARMSGAGVFAFSLVELAIAIYGGYFGGGIGIMVLGMFSAMGMRDIHAMNALRTILAVAINIAAVIAFIVARAVFWPQCLVMILGSLLGGWFGAHYTQKADPRKVRYAVIALGVGMSAYFFLTVR